MNRRNFIRLSLKAGIATATSGSLMALAAAKVCTVNAQEITVEGLPQAFDGFRIAFMADFHHSRRNSAAYIRDSVRQANALRPDLVALGGDYVDWGRAWVPGVIAELANLRARHGVVGVLGNHDHHGEREVRDGFRRTGITDLTNCGASLTRGGETLHLAGTGDYWREKQHLNDALRGVRRKKSVILLQHNPDYVERIQDDRVGLVLSGHTHGGQCVFPLIGAPILPSRYGQKYASGLCQGPLAQVFVTRGVGSSFPPIRINCPPEVALLTLRTPYERPKITLS